MLSLLNTDLLTLNTFQMAEERATYRIVFRKEIERRTFPVQSGHVALYIDRFLFMDVRSLVAHHGDAGETIEVIIAIFASVIDQKVFLLINQLQDIAPARLIIGCQLNGQSRTRLLAEPSVDAAGKVDPEPPGIAPAVLSFRCLHGDAAGRAHGRAEITGHTPLLPIRVPCEDDHRPRPRG